MKKYVLGVLALLVLLLGGALYARHELFRRAAGLPEFTTANWVASTVELPMRDGVKLHTEIYLPQGLERAPTILVRSPYEYLKPIEAMQCQTLTRFGYACVLQDARGQMASEGNWEPVLHERDDGLDTLAWLVKQPFVDGNIGMRGPSYLTCTQWAVADVLPPEVKTLIPSVFGTDLRKVFYERGLLRDDVLTAWATLMPGRGMRQTAGKDYLAAARFQPAIDADEKFMTKKLPWYRGRKRLSAGSSVRRPKGVASRSRTRASTSRCWMVVRGEWGRLTARIWLGRMSATGCQATRPPCSAGARQSYKHPAAAFQKDDRNERPTVLTYIEFCDSTWNM